MAGDNITPIYGEWLHQHLGYYQFNGKAAEDLQSRIKAIDITKAESDRELVECYRRFVELFVNDMFQVAFQPPTEGITTRHIKAYLVKNAYNVMAPIEFLEENGMRAEYNLAEYAERACQSLGSHSGTNISTAGFEAIREETDRVKGWKRSVSGTIFRGLLVLALTAFILWKSYSLIDWIASDMTNTFLKVIWVVVLLVVVVGLFKGIAELRAGMRRNKFLKTVSKCANFNVGAANNQVNSAQNNLSARIYEYRNTLKEALEKGTPTELPKVAGAGNLSKDVQNIDKEIELLNSYLGTSNKMKRKAGKLILILQVLAIFFLVSGREMVLNSAGKADSDNEQASQSSESTNHERYVDRVPVMSTYASSALESSKTGIVYGSELTIDGDTETCWQDGQSNDGTGEFIIYEFGGSFEMLNMEILNGRVSSEEKYYANGRIETLTLYCVYNGECVATIETALSDDYNSIQTIDMEGIVCDTVQMVVNSVYAGNTYDDLCLTEVAFNHYYYE